MRLKERKIYAICGYAGIGKTPLAENLRKVLGYDDSIHVNFADPLKKMLSVLGITDFTDKNEMTRFGVTKRELLISLGTRWGKNLFYDRSETNYNQMNNYIDIWIRLFDEKINSSYNKDRHVVCSDLRFIDEYQYIKTIKGCVIRITGNNKHKIDDKSEEYFKNFEVDYELDDSVDYFIEANKIVNLNM